jgi:hypothetical protein
MFEDRMAELRFARQLVSMSLVLIPPAGPTDAKGDLGLGVVSSVVPEEVWIA